MGGFWRRPVAVKARRRFILIQFNPKGGFHVKGAPRAINKIPRPIQRNALFQVRQSRRMFSCRACRTDSGDVLARICSRFFRSSGDCRVWYEPAKNESPPKMRKPNPVNISPNPRMLDAACQFAPRWSNGCKVSVKNDHRMAASTDAPRIPSIHKAMVSPAVRRLDGCFFISYSLWQAVPRTEEQRMRPVRMMAAGLQRYPGVWRQRAKGCALRCLMPLTPSASRMTIVMPIDDHFTRVMIDTMAAIGVRAG